MKKAPYERREGESVKAFEAFKVYRDMGMDRSLAKVGEKLGKSTTLMERWSSKYEWVERSQAYDDDIDRKAIIENEKKRKEMVKRHAQAATMFQSKVVERLNGLDPKELSPSELIRWFDISVKIERLSRGESTDISEVTHNGEVKEKHEYNIFQRVDRYADVYEKIANQRISSSFDEGDSD
ncbi:hypothetical protein COJ96_10835 [Bacillus sp. AFS073361]|nr:hypothetical protein COJ96_10835 [Bacillus sp. AFS073361]